VHKTNITTFQNGCENDKIPENDRQVTCTSHRAWGPC